MRTGITQWVECVGLLTVEGGGRSVKEGSSGSGLVGLTARDFAKDVTRQLDSGIDCQISEKHANNRYDGNHAGTHSAHASIWEMRARIPERYHAEGIEPGAARLRTICEA